MGRPNPNAFGYPHHTSFPEPGPTGATGAQGPPGPTGPQGLPGDSYNQSLNAGDNVQFGTIECLSLQGTTFVLTEGSLVTATVENLYASNIFASPQDGGVAKFDAANTKLAFFGVTLTEQPIIQTADAGPTYDGDAQQLLNDIAAALIALGLVGRV